jgi:hypothetical protein
VLCPSFPRVSEYACLDYAGMDCSSPGANPWRDLPQGCWHNILRFSDPPVIARVATLNRTCKATAYDDRLWCGPFRKAWSPEYCVSFLSSIAYNFVWYGIIKGHRPAIVGKPRTHQCIMTRLGAPAKLFTPLVQA